ncbi:hypothetical protein C0J52_21446 [Blattella germanica]|nr:hypothetical protein C0J52_21446 [Blattella germanica]
MFSPALTGNLDNTRVATRLGSKMIDGMNMLNLLLPGTAFTYYGEEIGMEDYRGGKLVEYPQRTPFLWNNSTNAGFSTNTSTLQINENFLEVNLQKQNETAKSHYNVYKKIAAIRKKLQEEDTSFTHFKEDGIFVFIRILSTNEYYIVAVNFGETDETIDLQDECEKLPDILEVYTSSIDSEKVEGENFTSNKIVLAGKEAVVFTGRLQPTTTTTTTTKTTTAESCACTESPGKGSQAYGGIFILLATSGLALSVQSAI